MQAFRSFFGGNDNKVICFRNFLTFRLYLMDEKFEDSPAGIPKRFVVLQFVDCLNKGLALKHKNTYFSPECDLLI